MRMPASLLLVAGGLSLVLSGCSTIPADAPLPPRCVTELERNAQSAGQLGIGAETTENGSIILRNVRRTRRGRTSIVPLNVRAFQPVRYPLVRFTINGHVLLGMVDSGSSTTLIEYDAAKRCHLVPLKPLVRTTGHGLGARVNQILAIASEVQMGSAEMSNVPFGILNHARGLDAFVWLDDYRIEAVLGSDFLRAFSTITVDYRNETMTVSSAGPYQPDPRRLAAQANLSAQYGVPAMEGWIGDRGPVPLAVDTGGDFGIWIPRGLAGRWNLPELETGPALTIGEGMGGQTLFKPIGTRTVRIGDRVLADAPALMSLINLGEAEPPFALIGNDILRQFVVTFDFAAGRLYLERPD